MKTTLRPIRSHTHLWLVSMLFIQAIALSLSPLVGAIAPQDTYSWQRDIGSYGCSPGPKYLTIANNRVYVIDGTSADTVSAHMFSLSGGTLGTFGSFGSGNGQTKYSSGVAHDAAGNIYIVDGGNHRVEKFDANGNFIMDFGSQGVGNGQFSNPQGIAIDSSGNIYVGDHGYSPNMARIEKFDSSGNYLSQFGSYGTGNGQFSYIQSIALDAAGNIYVADSDYSSVSRIQKFDTTGTYVSQFGSVGTGNGQFKYISQIAIDTTGTIITTDGNNRVQRFSTAGVYISQFGSTGTGSGQFDGPTGITLDSMGDIYVANADYSWTSTTGRIQKFDSSGNYLLQFTYSTAANLCGPQSATIGPDGNLYVADSGWWWGGWDNIKVYNPQTGVLLRTFGIHGTGDGQLQSPAGIVVNKSGDVYVVDSGGQRVEKFSSGGTYLAQIGGPGTGNGQFTNPYGVAIDSLGNVYVSDNKNSTTSRIEKFDSNGNYLSQIGSYGTGNGQFGFAAGIAIDASDVLYVVDSWGARIEKFDSHGVYLSQFTSSKLTNSPYGISVDTIGNIFVSTGDSNGDGVVKFDPNGTLLTSFNPYSSANGAAGYTLGVAVDLDGNVYAADNGTANDGTLSRISVWNAPVIPSSPQSVTVSDPTTTSLKVSWTPPAHVGSSPMLGYKVLYRSAGQVVGLTTLGTSFGFASLPFGMFGALPTGGWVTAGTVGAGVLNYTISGLNPNTKYDVQVAAFNSVGLSTDAIISQADLPYVAGTTLGGSLAATGENIWVSLGATTALLIAGLGLLAVRRIHR